jgi:hypothetical protein
VKIKKAKSSDLIEALYLTSTFPFKGKFPSYCCWSSESSFETVISEEIKAGQLFFIQHNVTIGMFALTQTPTTFVQEATFDSCLYIRYFTVFKQADIQEAAKEMFRFAENFAQENKYQHLVIEINESMPNLQQLAQANSFTLLPGKTFKCLEETGNLYIKNI